MKTPPVLRVALLVEVVGMGPLLRIREFREERCVATLLGAVEEAR
jgi:hypothetical protein